MTAELSLIHLVRQPVVPSAHPPMLLLLHGVGSSECAMASLAPLFDPRLLVLSVRAPYARSSGGYGWFDVAFTPSGPVIDPAQAEASRRALLAFAHEAAEAYGADPQQRYLFGFSQGAIMSASVALTAPEQVAGAVLHSGRILPEIQPLIAAPERLAGLPILVIHGTRDAVLPIQHGRASRDLLGGLPVALDYREYALDHRIDQQSLTAATGWLSGQLKRVPAH